MKKLTLLLAGLFVSTLQSFGQCGAPVVTFTAVENTTITLNFEAPVANMVDFDFVGVRFAATGETLGFGFDFFFGPNQPETGTMGSRTFNNLMPDTEYTFEIRGNCGAGNSFTTFEVTAMTTNEAIVTDNIVMFDSFGDNLVAGNGLSTNIPVTYSLTGQGLAIGTDLAEINMELLVFVRPVQGQPEILGTVLESVSVGTLPTTALSGNITDATNTADLNFTFPSVFSLDAGTGVFDLTVNPPTYTPTGGTAIDAGYRFSFTTPTTGVTFQTDDFSPFIPGMMGGTALNNVTFSSVTLGVSEFTKGDVSNLVTSANPVNSSIDLNASGDYTIVNLGGVTVQSGSFSGSVNVESLSTGIYFLAIDGGVYKFVKS